MHETLHFWYCCHACDLALVLLDLLFHFWLLMHFTGSMYTKLAAFCIKGVTLMEPNGILFYNCIIVLSHMTDFKNKSMDK